MPDGIFRDPKMNQRERNYGIIWSADKSQSFFYRKNENDWTRLALFGEVAEYDGKSIGPVLPDADPEDFQVSGTVELIRSLKEEEIALQLSPVYTRIGRQISDDIRMQAIMEAIKDGLPSDFNDPESESQQMA
jgi:hypothetical protein